MLQWIRDRVTGVVAFIILGLLSVPFLFWGIEQYSTTVPPEVVARVGSGDITVSEFQTSFANYRNRMRAQMGDRFNEAEFNRLVTRRSHLEQMINERLLRQYTEEAGLEVAPATLRNLIHGLPQFQVAGQFDPEVYRQALRAQGLTPARFQRNVEEALLAQVLTSAVSDSSIVTTAEVDQLLTLQNETRSLALIEVSSEPYRDTVEIGDDEIAEYYEQNSSEFMTTERVSVAYLELNAETLVPEVDIGEDELRQRYEAVRDRYMTPERRHAAHILITPGDERDESAAQALALELSERARAGESFAELAETYSNDTVSAREGGDLGWIEPGVMARAFEEALYALEIGEVSEPVQTGFGWHVITLERIDESRGQSFEEARAEILEEIREDEAESLFAELTDRLVDMVYGDPTSLNPIADELDLEIQRTEPFTRSGGDGIAANSEVIEVAFSDMVLLDGDTSEPIEIAPGHLVVVRVAEHFPAELRSLENVEEELRQRLVRERAIELAKAQAETIAESLGEAGADPREIAEAHELELVRHDALTRRSFELGGRFVTEVFELPHPRDGGEVHVLPKGSDWGIVILEGVAPGDPAAADDAERTRIQRQIQFARSGAEIGGLIEYLRENTRIRIQEDRMDARF